MRIDKVIHSSNDDPFYLDFWEIVSKIWNLKFGVTPVLIYFGESKVSEQYGSVIKLNAPEGIPINTCCQLSRYWLPSTEENAVFMTSDIDMLPISKWYFMEQIKDIEDDKFVNLNCAHGQNGYFPCCYNVAKGSTFKEVLSLKDDWEEFITNGFWKSYSYNHTPNGLNKVLPHWVADEEWSGKLISEFDQSRVVRLYREHGLNYRRIDRGRWNWSKDDIGSHYDCHSIRPYSSHKTEIDSIVECILSS